MATFLYLGQNAINVGLQVEKVLGILDLSNDACNGSSIYRSLYIEDMKTTKCNGFDNDKDNHMMLHYIEMIDNQVRMALESSCLVANQNITLVTDLSSSNVSDVLLTNIHDYFPWLPLHSIYLSQQSCNSYTALKAIKKIYTALHLCDSIMIRETKDVIHYFEKENKQYFQQTDIDFYIACDVISGYCSSSITGIDTVSSITPTTSTNTSTINRPAVNRKQNIKNDSIGILDNNISLMNWPFNVCSQHHKFHDVRSSLWKCLYYNKKRKDMLNTTGIDSTSVTDQFHSLRALSSNLASLHQCYFPSTVAVSSISSLTINELTREEELLRMNKNVIIDMQETLIPFSIVTLSSTTPVGSSSNSHIGTLNTSIANKGVRSNSSKLSAKISSSANTSNNIMDTVANVIPSSSLLNLSQLSESIYTSSEVISALSSATLSLSSSSSFSSGSFTWCDIESIYTSNEGNKTNSASMTTGQSSSNNRLPATAVYTRPQLSNKIPGSSGNNNNNKSHTISYEAVSFVSPYALCFVAHACQVSEGLIRMGAYKHSIGSSDDASYGEYKDCLAALTLALFEHP